MDIMKKIILLFSILVLVFGFTACQSNNEDPDKKIEDESDGSDETNNQDDGESQDETDQQDEITDETDSQGEKDGDENTLPVDGDHSDDEKNSDEGGNSSENGNIIEGSLEDILAKIYATAEVDDYFKEYAESGLLTNEITEERSSYYFGTDIEFEEAIASEPMMSTSAYSLCLLRAKDGADIEQIKKDIKENADPMKWICVGVDPKNVFVENIDDVIMLVMSDDQGQALRDAFLGLK